MSDRVIRIDAVAEVAKALKEIKIKVAFIGGAIVGLYADDMGADEIRETKDVDIALGLVTYSGWSAIQEKLFTLGFHPDPFGPSICRFKYKDIPVDIMSSADNPLGPSNRWYSIGFESLQEFDVEGVIINIFSAPIFLATKFDAFNDRGGDYRTSKDFEDIIYVIDNRQTIVQEVEQATRKVKEYLVNEIEKILRNPMHEEFISSHISPLTYHDRYPIVIERLKRIISKDNH